MLYINHMKEILYRSHAITRMNERNISTLEVEKIITSPDGTIKQSLDKKIYYKDFPSRNDNIIAVVALEQEVTYEILTVMINFEVHK